MTHFKTAFPGKYLQIADLGTPIVGTIKTVTIETVGAGDDAGQKPVVRFLEEEYRPLVLNLTRAAAIAAIAGDDIEHWIGIRIRISRGHTSYKGKPTPCIVVVVLSGDTF